MRPEHAHLPSLLSVEQAAELLDLQVPAIGRLVKMNLLCFYRGLTFLRADVVRFAESESKYLPELRRQFAPPPPPVPSPWHLTTADE